MCLVGAPQSHRAEGLYSNLLAPESSWSLALWENALKGFLPWELGAQRTGCHLVWWATEKPIMQGVFILPCLALQACGGWVYFTPLLVIK